MDLTYAQRVRLRPRAMDGDDVPEGFRRYVAGEHNRKRIWRATRRVFRFTTRPGVWSLRGERVNDLSAMPREPKFDAVVLLLFPQRACPVPISTSLAVRRDSGEEGHHRRPHRN